MTTRRRGRRLITSAQETYLRRLANEAFSHLFPSGVDSHHLGGMTMEEASQHIDRLKAAKAAGWVRQ